ncbi:DUF2953 domain-containing protein [Desertibacillus haloalkaliphilus]|nr:DUF2953 domain-containing protein [Desertibacillus haloalkaliphilus]
MRVWKFISYTFKAPLIKIDEDSASIVVKEEQKIATTKQKKDVKITPQKILDVISDLKNFLQHVIGFHQIVKRFMRHISIHKFEWRSQLGLGDAAQTGMIVGMGWSLKGAIVGILSHYMRLKQNPKVSIDPTYNQQASYTNMTCMISFRIGHAIVATIMIVRHWRRRPPLFQSAEKNANV